jgi:ATP-binding cassette subfamily B protein
MNHIRRILPYVKPYWAWSAISLFLLTAVVFMDLAIPRLIQRIIDQGINQKNQAVVVQTAVIMLIISLVSTLFALGNNYYSILVGESVGRDLREALFLKIQSFSHGNLDHFTTGKLMVRLSSDSGAAQRLVQVTLRIGTRAPMLMIGSLILMFSTSQAMALTILPLLLVTGVIIVFFSVKMEPMYRFVQQKLDWMNTVLQENIAGVRVVKAFVRADRESQRFESANDDFTRSTIRVMQFMSSLWPASTVVINIGMVVVIWAGGLRVMEGQMTQGQIIAFANYLMTTLGPLTMMAMLSNTWANGFASMQRIEEVIDTEPEVQEKAQPISLPDHITGRVVFENVTFHYNGSCDEPVLQNINLTTTPGQMVAILGATGAGKSSLVNLVPRFYDVAGGRVLVDGYDLRDLSQQSLISQVGIVPQETILFSGSVRDNIRYGRPDASEDEVITAAQVAQAHEFILKLPQGYDTHVEERGVNLSGGQKQRLAIARAIITRPKILIFDDSTSSVDVETETKIQHGLDAVLKDSTRFVVAQRISTVLNADKIIVIDQGRIAAEGTHVELMQTSPIYREIYDSQLGDGFRTEQIFSGHGVEASAG